ncbi:hypothetical protein M1105_11200 [Limibaculum sp. FT325]|uniref:hypothetical protein n=1 Tax=Thermohalobaculum sediminis TaxID=2939436 RepID=UPI0020BD5950|nr:hypothetical protein [Limibaculum sediminis]MCL5777551.1 hypothetical protein [Limibaculum sediminis]
MAPVVAVEALAQHEAAAERGVGQVDGRELGIEIGPEGQRLDEPDLDMDLREAVVTARRAAGEGADRGDLAARRHDDLAAAWLARPCAPGRARRDGKDEPPAQGGDQAQATRHPDLWHANGRRLGGIWLRQS